MFHCHDREGGEPTNIEPTILGKDLGIILEMDESNPGPTPCIKPPQLELLKFLLPMISVVFTMVSTVMFSIQLKATRKELCVGLTIITIIIIPSQGLAAYCIAKIWNKGAESYATNEQYIDNVVLPAVFSTTDLASAARFKKASIRQRSATV